MIARLAGTATALAAVLALGFGTAAAQQKL